MIAFGGIDFDEAFSSSVVGFVSANGIAVDADDPATAAALVRLREEGRRAKEALSSEPETTVHVDLPGFQTELPLTREDFEDLIRPHIAETIGALARVTESAGFTFHGLDRILLIGGSSRIPLVAEMVGEATNRPITVDANSKDSIALGAAFVAEQRRLSAETNAAAAAGVVGTGSILGMEAAAAMDAVVGDEADAAPPTEAIPVVVAEPAATSARGGRRFARRRSTSTSPSRPARSTSASQRPARGRSRPDPR
jgi:molecular chaperone DnaK (HSP70)